MWKPRPLESWATDSLIIARPHVACEGPFRTARRLLLVVRAAHLALKSRRADRRLHPCAASRWLLVDLEPTPQLAQETGQEIVRTKEKEP